MNVLVIGGSRGIGYSVAKLCVHLGHSVTVTSRSAQTAQNVAESFNMISKERKQSMPHLNVASHYGIGVDITDCSSVETAFYTYSTLERTKRPLDAIICSAGITQNSLLMRTTDEQIQSIINTNLMGTIYVCRSAVKYMFRQRTPSSILCVGSVVGQLGNSGQSVYAASKSALIGFTKSLAAEVASRQIRVNMVSPGFTDTDMTDIHSTSSGGLHAAARTNAIERTLLKRTAAPDEIADTIAWISGLYSTPLQHSAQASDETKLTHKTAQFITGANINVDGGIGVSLN